MAENKSSNKVSAFVRREIGRVAALASLVVIFIFFAIMRPVFASWDNVSGGILMSTTVIGLLAIGVTFVIITAGIDLSVGTSMTLVAVIVGKTVMAFDLSVWSGILLGMLVGASLGAINGILITMLRLPPFIATLATMKGAQGLALIVSDMKPVLFATDVEGWDQIAQGNIIPNFPNGALILFVAALATGAKFTWIGRAYLYGLMAGGKPGVDKALEIMRMQIIRTMKLLGARTVAELNPDHVRFIARYSDK